MCLSSTNYSLIPLEMLACGCPVVELNLPGVARNLPVDSLCMTDPTPESIADSLTKLLYDTKTWQLFRHKGMETASALPWEQSVKQVVQVFDHEFRKPG